MDQTNLKNAKNELQSVLGDKNVIDEDFILSSYTRDGTLFYRPLSLPSLIVFPHSTEDVRKIVLTANKYRIPLTATGGRTSHWGAIDPNGGIVLDMSHMREVIDIDEQNLTFTVQAGANVHHVSGILLKKRGFCYPAHALNFAPITFGAEVVKNTGGEVGCMYGHVAKRIVGLEVVLGTGEVLSTGSSRVIKNAPHFQQSGIPDLTQLFVASEGALGVITEVTMGMTKVAVAEAGVDMKFNEGSFDNAVKACHEIRMKKVARNAHLIDLYIEGKLMHLFLLEIESLLSQEECDLKKRAAIEICKEYGGEYVGGDLAHAATPESEGGGREFLEKLIESNVGKVPMLAFADVPYSNVSKIHKRFLEILREFDWPVTKTNFVGAFGDESCLTFCILQQDPRADEEQLKKCRDLYGKLLAFYTEIGCIPYRIGRIWRPYILDKLDPTYLRHIRSQKRLYDPNNIMNPGVSVFEEHYS